MTLGKIRLRGSVFLAFAAMLIHIAVFLQPLLPEKIQITQVCVTIAELVVKTQITTDISHHKHSTIKQVYEIEKVHHSDSLDKHTVDHYCIFCIVYGHLVSYLNLEITEVFQRLQIRLLTFQKNFKHVFFILQRLFLNPQGRAPPLFT